MARATPSPDAAHGADSSGGFGAVETMLALRALAGEHVRVTLVSASPTLALQAGGDHGGLRREPAHL